MSRYVRFYFPNSLEVFQSGLYRAKYGGVTAYNIAKRLGTNVGFAQSYYK